MGNKQNIKKVRNKTMQETIEQMHKYLDVVSGKVISQAEMLRVKKAALQDQLDTMEAECAIKQAEIDNITYYERNWK